MQDALKRVVLRKVAWRLLPFLFLLYVVNILDRVNVGFARLQMLDDLQMGERAYALGAGIFYIGYLIFEIQQPDSEPRRRPSLDRAHLDQLGADHDGDDGRPRPLEFLSTSDLCLASRKRASFRELSCISPIGSPPARGQRQSRYS